MLTLVAKTNAPVDGHLNAFAARMASQFRAGRVS
jgi:hypothetical protein